VLARRLPTLLETPPCGTPAPWGRFRRFARHADRMLTEPARHVQALYVLTRDAVV